MKIFITGGAGFIGSWLSESLIRSGHQVTSMDDLSTGSIDNLKNIINHPNYKFIQNDILTSPVLEEEIRNADCTIHLAAAVGVELVVKDPVRTIMTNVQGTERVLKAASDHAKRCIIASTSEVYGKSTKDTFSEGDDLLIGPSTHSRWSYACSKLLDEFMLMAYHRNKDLPGTVVRFFNTVGPRQTGRYGMVIPRFVAAAMKGEDLRVYGTGEQTRCFCHVNDTVRALEKLIPDTASAGNIYNIGSTRSITIMELAKLIIERTNSTSKIAVIPYSEAYEKGFEDMLHRAPDCSKMLKSHGWKAEISLEQIIDDVAEYYRNNGF